MLRFLLLFLSCVLLLVTLSQKGDTAYRKYLQSYLSAETWYHKATALSNAADYTEEKEAAWNRKALDGFRELASGLPTGSMYDSLRFFTHFKIGELEHYFENYVQALDGYNRAIAIKKWSRLPDSLLFKPYLYAGMIHYNQNRYDTAAQYFGEAEKVQALYRQRLQESERLYNIFGVLRYEKGDYKQARNYFLEAIELLSPGHPYYEDLLVNYRINLAQINLKLEDYDGANRIYQELLHSFKVNHNEIHHNIGMIHLSLGAPEKALDHFRKVHYTNNKIIRLYNSMGEAFLQQKELDSASMYFARAVEAHQAFGHNSDPVAHGITLKNQGDLMVQDKKPADALRYYQQALHAFYPSFPDASGISNPQKFSGVFSYIHLFNTLISKAEALHLLYEQKDSVPYAEGELDSYRSAFSLIDYVERTYNSDEARLFIDKIKYVVHAHPIDIAYELYQRTGRKEYLEELYIFDQQNKASILSLRQEVSEQAAAGDSSILREENRLRSAITRLSLKAVQVKDSAELARINRSIRDMEIELGKVQEEMAGTTATVSRIPSVEFLQEELLQDNTLLVSFHLSPRKLTTLVIGREQIDAHQDSLPENFHEAMQDYIRTVENASSTDYKEQGKNIFRLLFTGIDLRDIERMILIPDDELNYLSFESLQDDQGEYLVRNYSIQYQYTAALLKKDRSRLTGHRILAMAPFARTAYHDSSLQLPALPHSLKEINMLKGSQFQDSAASKKTFLHQLDQFRVLHLATHAVVNNQADNLSFIAFAPSASRDPHDFLLYEEEIYQLPMQHTELVILSACQTGTGDLEKGEGIMSLSRAFTYAGCPNMITSLWNANDFSTSYIARKFHGYLDQGHTIDEALQQAKVDYLDDQAVNPRLKHPFYWSHLVFIGNYNTGRGPVPGWPIALTALLFLLLAGLLLFKKSRRRRDSFIGGADPK